MSIWSECGPPDTSDEAEDRGLLSEYRAGRIEPVEGVVPTLPADATPPEHRVRDFFALHYGLRLAACQKKPVPFARSWIVENTGLSPTVAGRARAELVECRVLVEQEPLPGRGGKSGTKTYLPGEVEVEATVVIRNAELRKPERPVSRRTRASLRPRINQQPKGRRDR